MNWTKTIFTARQKLSAALSRDVASENEIGPAIDTLTKQRDALFLVIGEHERTIDRLNIELAAAHESHKITQDKLAAAERMVVNRDRALQKIIEDYDHERTKYRIPRGLQWLFIRKPAKKDKAAK